MKVACVILNWNGWLDTIECLASVLRSTHDDFHVVACDNGSQDGSFRYLQEWAGGRLAVPSRDTVKVKPYRAEPIPHAAFASPADAMTSPAGAARVTFIQTGSNLGYAGGNNVGIRYALEKLHAQYVWILNNDTVVDRRAMSALATFLQSRPETAIAGARLLQYHTPGQIQALGGGAFLPNAAHDTQIGRGSRTHDLVDVPFALDHVVGASMMVRADAIRDVGLIDESYFLYREETDWCIRMRERGWHLMYCPSALVWHKERHTSRFKTMLYDYYSVRNMLFVISRFYPKAVPLAFLASLARVFGPKLARLQLKRAYVSSRAFLDFLKDVRGMHEVDPEITLRRIGSPDREYVPAEVVPPTA